MFRNSVAFLVRQIKSQQRQEPIIESLCAFKVGNSNMNMVNHWFHIGTSATLRMFHKHPTMEPLACNS